MKTIFLYLTLLTIPILFNYCGGTTKQKDADSASNAEKENKARLPDSSFENDASFAVAAAEEHILQAKTAQLCETNASLDTVLKFGRTLVKNHTTINNQLTDWAKANNVSLPNSLTSINKSKYDELANEKNRAFEKKFTQYIINDYQELLDNYRREAENGKDTILKAWAREKIRILETDLQTANWIDAVLTKPPLKNKS
jgi:putative membrane protein